MKKQREIGNKGFSLVELIIVIAIMAILVGVLAPNLLRYIEKTNVSADTQLADSIKTAVTTAMMDPAVLNAPGDTSANDFITNHPKGGTGELSDCTGAFQASLIETLGVSNLDTALVDKLKSANSSPKFVVEIDGSTVVVTITGTDANAKKEPATGPDITVQ